MIPEDLVRLAAPLPPASEITIARARDRALVAFRNQPSPSGHASPWRPMPRWLAGAGAVLAAVMLGIFYPRADESSSLMDEMEQVFPGRVAGVITRDQDVDIVLYDVPLLRPEDQRVAFTISGPDGETTVFTYSGNKISVDSGQTLTPLLSGNGGVVVIGDDGSVIKGWRVRG